MKYVRDVFLGVLLLAAIGGLGLAAVHAEQDQTAPQYIRFSRFLVPVTAGSEIRGLMAIRVELEAANAKDRQRIERLRPRLADAYYAALAREAALATDPRRPLDMPRLEALLNTATRATLGPDISVRLFITDAAVRAA